MDKNYLDGLKFGLGFLTIFGLLLGVVFAVGFHSAEEILGGTFSGVFIFEDNVTFNGNVSGISGLGVPSGAVLNFEATTCPVGFNLDSKQYTKESPNNFYYQSQYDAGTHAAANAIDGNTGTYWSSSEYPNSATNIWLAFRYDDAKIIDRLRFYPRSTSLHVEFKNFGVYGSNDSTNGIDGNWNLIENGLNTANTLAWDTIDISNSQKFNWYKVTGPAVLLSGSAYYIQLSEIEMYSSKVTCIKD